MSINEIVHYLESKECKLKGCSVQEIAAIEKHYKVRLPSSYVEFLQNMGISAGEFLKGSSMFYDEIFDLREGAIELLADNDFKQLPDDTFVFFMHQGYQLAFFYLTDGDDPPVYYYYEGRNEGDFEKKEESFTNFLESQLVMSGLK